MDREGFRPAVRETAERVEVRLSVLAEAEVVLAAVLAWAVQAVVPVR